VSEKWKDVSVECVLGEGRLDSWVVEMVGAGVG
jgi:hypothetical protein